MEIALKSELPTYCGGLGVLAGDYVRSSADLGIPLIGVTLVSKEGYFCQDINENGQQIESPEPYDPSKYMDSLPENVDVQIQGRNVKVKAWCYKYTSPHASEGVIPILFLDTDVHGNQQEDRKITSVLYGGDQRYRLKQEIVLGIGGIRMLHALGFNAQRYHMNEGHSGLLGLELLQKFAMDEQQVKQRCVFTTHTPVKAAHDKFPYDLVQEIMGNVIPLEKLKKLGGQDKLNMTQLALNLSQHCNGVSNKHREITAQLFPNHKIRAITNGVHSYTWTHPRFRELYDSYILGWANEPELLARTENIPDEEIWRAHVAAKKELIDYVNKNTDIDMQQNVLTLGFARRATAYKRANFLFSDLQRLRDIAKKYELQIIFSGKSHQNNLQGKQLIQELFTYMHELRNVIKIVYLKNYNIEQAAKLVSGTDVWLNTPLPPFEASGTSGMKAAHNGVLNFSVLDGWWIEGCLEGVTGWAIGPHPNISYTEEERKIREMEDLYAKLMYIIAPMYYKRRSHWIEMMKKSIAKIAYYFN
ncbi:MAG: alpha-glucan family phosphorylase, partial [Candidatus Bathyarchaeota archaeon]